MKLKLLTAALVGLCLAACANAPIPDDQKTPYNGIGEISSVMVRDDQQQEVSVLIEGQGYIVVMLKEPADLFPGQKVRVKRHSGGYGEVSVQ
ncbi:hypothetical protein B9T21_00825 [Wohlfahrtiimonas chitiniclastica]|uniref:hypothetical protein n=1 Tax=Wohlfahrtiimonas chitiniclastica TaxID=400946 RepID=UPI000B9989E0|nr:hypothetical protein [Wohlfahrtiimonas chitiniclastica]OYQ89317.1 hypothetical protein B9T21_00825 [Wohlfahrtiimonas chitiniclastica]